MSCRDGFLDGDRLQPILEGLARTTAVAVTGLAIAFVIGTLVAILMSQAIWLERTLYPYAVILQTVPLVAIAPIIGLKMGFSTTSQVVICVIISSSRSSPTPCSGCSRRPPASTTSSRCTRREPVDAAGKLQFPAALSRPSSRACASPPACR